MKRCSSCRVEKPEEEFPANRGAYSDPRCKECKRASARAWRAANRLRHRESVKAWRKVNRTQFNNWRKQQRHKREDQTRAHRALTRAVHQGKMVKPATCEKCGKGFQKANLSGHHHKGYAYPLEVMWLCARCHLEEHGVEVAT